MEITPEQNKKFGTNSKRPKRSSFSKFKSWVVARAKAIKFYFHRKWINFWYPTEWQLKVFEETDPPSVYKAVSQDTLDRHVAFHLSGEVKAPKFDFYNDGELVKSIKIESLVRNSEKQFAKAVLNDEIGKFCDECGKIWGMDEKGMMRVYRRQQKIDINFEKGYVEVFTSPALKKFPLER